MVTLIFLVKVEIFGIGFCGPHVSLKLIKNCKRRQQQNYLGGCGNTTEQYSWISCTQQTNECRYPTKQRIITRM